MMERQPVIRPRGTLIAVAAAATAALITLDYADAYLVPPRRHKIQPSFPSPANTNVFPSSITNASIRPQTKRSRQTRFYIDQWSDAELSFHKNNSAPAIKPKRSLPPFQQFMLKFTKLLYNLKELIRTRLERCTVYILELENGKYYIGSTTNRKRRIREHIRRRGSKWTKIHKPLRVLREYRRIPSKYVLGMESRITAECMLQYGVNNVRGSMFCSTRQYHMGDVEALTKFIGHYNDLNYRKVNARLLETLPATPGKRFRVANDGKCFRCGKRGHFVANCPERLGSKRANETVFL